MKKLFDGQFSKTLENVELNEVVNMGFSRHSFGICTHINYDVKKRDFVVFKNIKKNGKKGKYSHSFIKPYLGYSIWEDCHSNIEWKRG